MMCACVATLHCTMAAAWPAAVLVRHMLPVVCEVLKMLLVLEAACVWRPELPSYTTL